MPKRSPRKSPDAWRDLIATRFPQSGLTRTEFCRRNGLSAATFDHWRRKLSSLPVCEGISDTSDFVEIAPPSPSAFVASRPGWHLELELGQGITLRMNFA
jgi:hypothetical protein